jgi:oligosaccharide repeat unit polymerase
MPTLWPRSDVLGCARAALLGLYALLGLGVLAASFTIHAGWLDPYHPAFLRPLCGVSLLVFVLSLLSWRAWTGAWFDSYTIFLAAAHAFNAGQAFLEALGLHDHGILDGQFPQNDVVDAVLFVTLCLVALHGGALLAAITLRPTSAASTDAAGPNLADVRAVAWMLLVVAVPSMAYVFLSDIGTALREGYLALYSQPHDVGLAAIPKILSAFLVPASLFLLAGSKESPAGRWTSVLVLAANAVCQLLLGFRFYAIMPLAAYAWVRNRCIRPLPVLPLIAAAAFFAIVVFPIIRQTRDVGGGRRNIANLTEAFGYVDNPAISTLDEMGGSIMTTIYTLELVPASRDFEYGETYFYALFKLVPNVAWDIHPSIAHTPSVWLIQATDPWLSAKGGSIGFSFLAEAYFNFGWTGGPWIIGLVGFAFARMTLWATRPPGLVEAKIAMMAAFVSFFAFVAREDLGFVTRPLVWYSILPYAAIHFLAWARFTFRATDKPAEAANPGTKPAEARA